MKPLMQTIQDYIFNFEYHVQLIQEKMAETDEHLYNASLSSAVQITEAALCINALKCFILSTEKQFGELRAEYRAACQREVYTDELTQLVNHANGLLHQRDELLAQFHAKELAIIAELDGRASTDTVHGDKLKSLSLFVKERISIPDAADDVLPEVDV